MTKNKTTFPKTTPSNNSNHENNDDNKATKTEKTKNKNNQNEKTKQKHKQKNSKMLVKLDLLLPPSKHWLVKWVATPQLKRPQRGPLKEHTLLQDIFPRFSVLCVFRLCFLGTLALTHWISETPIFAVFQLLIFVAFLKTNCQHLGLVKKWMVKLIPKRTFAIPKGKNGQHVDTWCQQDVAFLPLRCLFLEFLIGHECSLYLATRVTLKLGNTDTRVTLQQIYIYTYIYIYACCRVNNWATFSPLLGQ